MNFKIPFFLILFFCVVPVTAQKSEPAKIGLLIQDNAQRAAFEGAALAIKMANVRGGYQGRPFQLVTKGMEGPWGTGSKQAVDLIFEDNVWALLGSHDGRNGHLVEQAATKSIVAFVSTWSSDPTLTQAFVPWFYNCVPTDAQQADVLIEEIYIKRKLDKVAILSDNTYDSKMALKSFLKSLQAKGMNNKPHELLFEDYSSSMNQLADKLMKEQVKGIVLVCNPTASLKVIQLMKQYGMKTPIFGSLSILNENELSEGELREFENRLYIASGNWTSSKYKTFRQAYYKSYGRMPGMVASYAFDGMSVLLEAIKKCNSQEREEIQQTLSAIQFDGITGIIQFNSNGSRKGPFDMAVMRNGIPVGALQ
jgi:branched-chain amino acid transport system substrate-binding protein